MYRGLPAAHSWNWATPFSFVCVCARVHQFSASVISFYIVECPFISLWLKLCENIAAHRRRNHKCHLAASDRWLCRKIFWCIKERVGPYRSTLLLYSTYAVHWKVQYFVFCLHFWLSNISKKLGCKVCQKSFLWDLLLLVSGYKKHHRVTC